MQFGDIVIGERGCDLDVGVIISTEPAVHAVSIVEKKAAEVKADPDCLGPKCLGDLVCDLPAQKLRVIGRIDAETEAAVRDGLEDLSKKRSAETPKPTPTGG